MKLFIPKIGTRLVLSSPWATKLSSSSSSSSVSNTTFPQGTVICVESYHIQKGHTPRIAIRIAKDNSTNIPSGRFIVTVDEINKMEVESEITNKYPKGRFSMYMSSGIEPYYTRRCQCTSSRSCLCQPTNYKQNVLSWTSDADSAEKYRAILKHKTDTKGLDEITIGKYCRVGGCSYSRHFESVESLLNWAQKKGFSNLHIDAFIKEYDIQRIAWEQSKA